MSTEAYRYTEIEAKWRAFWDARRLHEGADDDPRPKYYCLDMFPYPSGSGLHVGHWRSYVLPDCWARYKRLQGYNVLHPMGWDAFGSPAENDAIQKGIHPAISTRRNIDNFKRQLREIGAMFDWSREVNTSDPDYFKWTQWIFLRMFKAGLAYKTFVPVNWCPSCKTGIANEDVVGDRCERCGTKVTKKELNQWMLGITRYADRLLKNLVNLDWPEKVKSMQSNWIGRSEGAEASFIAIGADGECHPLKVFTTRPDTLFGVTYLVIAPEHRLVPRLVSPDRKETVEAYREKVQAQSDIDRTTNAEKSGVFLGTYAINPINGEKVPIWTADYVLASYGTGAIMGVPAHDERDWVFAKAFGLPARQVISSETSIPGEPYIGEGKMIHSGPFTGLSSEHGRKAVTQWLEKHRAGRARVSYKLRDWVFSRQRYWGEPIPIIHCASCGEVPVGEKDLPLRLPEVERYQPTGTGQSPLAAIAEWVNVPCPNCGGPAKRETDTMPQWAGSSWYFLRYASPHATDALITEAGKKWLPVDLYVGGIEHAVLHLLYARFFTMFLKDIGVIDFEEPFRKLFNQGMIVHAGPGGKAEKMSKSRGNVVSPDELTRTYGCDSLRLYELFVGPPESDAEWNDKGIEGIHRFLRRSWHWVLAHNRWSASPSREVLVARHLLVKKVTERMEAFRLNTVVSAFMEFVNEVSSLDEEPDKETVEVFLITLAPFAPHFSEELWERTGHLPSIFDQRWPSWDESLTTSDTATISVQVNGRLRGTIVAPTDAPETNIVNLAIRNPRIARYLSGKRIERKVYVKNRLLNLVVSESATAVE
jgi:leucyl-tRNA synthetase